MLAPLLTLVVTTFVGDYGGMVYKVPSSSEADSLAGFHKLLVLQQPRWQQQHTLLCSSVGLQCRLTLDRHLLGLHEQKRCRQLQRVSSNRLCRLVSQLFTTCMQRVMTSLRSYN